MNVASKINRMSFLLESAIERTTQVNLDLLFPFSLDTSMHALG